MAQPQPHMNIIWWQLSVPKSRITNHHEPFDEMPHSK